MPDDLTKRIGIHIRRLRAARPMSQEELALKAGIARNNLSHVENGKAQVSVVTLDAICRVLHLSLAEFFEDLPLR